MKKSALAKWHARLKEEKLYIADVGATGGVEEKWKPFVDLCHFYTFDPDPRTKKWEIDSTNFPIGLWSQSCQKTLYLKQYPPASSLFETDEHELKDFGFEESFRTIGKKEISVEPLDQVLRNKPLDFLKIDAEGAELEILKGGGEILNRILGLQVEVFFFPVRKNAPLFGDIESHLRKNGFYTYRLSREHWIRKNRIYGHQSSPQLIWGNALFLPCKEKLLSLVEGDRFTKFVLILLVYQLHDYAMEICLQKNEKELSALVKECAQLPAFFLTKLLFSLCAGSSKYLLAFSSKKRAKKGAYLKRKIRTLGSLCLSVGKNNFAVYDE